jgi:hypothetical protein
VALIKEMLLFWGQIMREIDSKFDEYRETGVQKWRYGFMVLFGAQMVSRFPTIPGYLDLVVDKDSPF